MSRPALTEIPGVSVLSPASDMYPASASTSQPADLFSVLDRVPQRAKSLVAHACHRLIDSPDALVVSNAPRTRYRKHPANSAVMLLLLLESRRPGHAHSPTATTRHSSPG